MHLEPGDADVDVGGIADNRRRRDRLHVMSEIGDATADFAIPGALSHFRVSGPLHTTLPPMVLYQVVKQSPCDH